MKLTDLLQATRATGDDRLAAGIRIALGVLFAMTGAMKVAVPALAAAFAGQLAGANIPFAELNRWLVPVMEIALGGVLLTGHFTRIATLLVFAIMVVATYTHVAVDDPSLFPLQPEQPILPIVVMILAVYPLWRGAGPGSADLRAWTDRSHALER